MMAKTIFTTILYFAGRYYCFDKKNAGALYIAKLEMKLTKNQL